MPSVRVLDGNDVNDIPARYYVPTLQPYEFPVVGIYIDRRVVPGFKYRIRPIDTEVSTAILPNQGEQYVNSFFHLIFQGIQRPIFVQRSRIDVAKYR